MSELQRMFERQTNWQKSLRSLSWPEKVHMVEKIKDSVEQLKAAPCVEENRKSIMLDCDQDAS